MADILRTHNQPVQEEIIENINPTPPKTTSTIINSPSIITRSPTAYALHESEELSTNTMPEETAVIVQESEELQQTPETKEVQQEQEVAVKPVEIEQETTIKPVIEEMPVAAATSTTTLNNTILPKPTNISFYSNQPSTVVDTPPAPYKQLDWGVFTGSNAGAIKDFEQRVETNPDYLAFFVHWGNGDGALPSFLKTYARDKDRTLVLFWEASDYTIGGTNQPAYSYQNILNGNWDDYFEDFADQLENYRGEVILIPFSELNGNWTPWSGTKNGNTPEKAVQAYRYIHDYFNHLNNVKFGWAVNASSVPNTPENKIENYYPGDAYVDIVGVDGFNDGPPWYTFEEIFTRPLDTLSQYNKPIFIFSFASAEGPNKAKWMTEGFFDVIPRYKNIEAWIWFNQNKERNWLLWSDDDAWEVFLRAIGEETD